MGRDNVTKSVDRCSAIRYDLVTELGDCCGGHLGLAKDNDRFLRNPSLRAALYYNANGLCQRCGNPLPDGWHADHVVPWSVTQRTNVFEMQALCPNCNLHKGGKTVRRLSVFDFNKDRFRLGQRDAFARNGTSHSTERRAAYDYRVADEVWQVRLHAYDWSLSPASGDSQWRHGDDA